MFRSLIVICLSIVVLSGCKKANGDAVQVREQATKDDQLIADYITANHLTAVKVKLSKAADADTTGVWYVLNTPGTGTNFITTSSLITVGYTGRILTSGKEIAKTTDLHPGYRMGDMMKGWQLGILHTDPKMRKGGKVRLLIASRYAYGPYDQPTLGIPANSVLDFDIEIFDVTN